MGQAKRNKDLFKEYMNLLSAIGNMSNEPEAFEAASNGLARFSEQFMKVDTSRDINERLHQMALNSNDYLVQTGLNYYMDTFLSESMPCTRFNSDDPATTLMVACRISKPASHAIEIIDDVSGLQKTLCAAMGLAADKVHVWEFVLSPETYTRSITAITLETYVARNGGHEWMAAENSLSDTKNSLVDTVLFAVTIDAPSIEVVHHCSLDCSPFDNVSVPYTLGDQLHSASIKVLEVGAGYSIRQQYAFMVERNAVAKALKDTPSTAHPRDRTGIHFSLAYCGDKDAEASVGADDIVFVMEFFDVNDGNVFMRIPVSTAQDAMFVIPHISHVLRSSGYAEVYILGEQLDLLQDETPVH